MEKSYATLKLEEGIKFTNSIHTSKKLYFIGGFVPVKSKFDIDGNYVHSPVTFYREIVDLYDNFLIVKHPTPTGHYLEAINYVDLLI